MLITFVFLILLLIVGLFTSTFLNFPTKKFKSWFQFLCLLPDSNITNMADTSHKIVAKSSSSCHEKAELKSVFATFDRNKDGFITKEELSESLGNIGIWMSEKEVADMVEKVDSNGDGLIDLDEFCELFETMMASREGEGEEEGGGKVEDGEGEGDLKEAFNVFDGDRDGLITVEELGLVLSSLGFKEGKMLEDCKEMIRKVDMDGDGMVNFDEFRRMMKAGGRLVAVS